MREEVVERVVASGNKGISLVVIKGVIYMKDFLTDTLIEFDDNTKLELKDKKLYVVARKGS